jgi:sugar lactone lactonase YvrE
MHMQTFLHRVSVLLGLILLSATAFAQTAVVPAAGNGAAGFSGDGGQATAASLNGPSDVAVDAAGNFYIADRNNNRVRKVKAADTVINTFAGNGDAGSWYLENGPAVGSVMNHPFAVTTSLIGEVFIADFGGWSSVDFTNLYIADFTNNAATRIHRVDLAGSIHQVQVSGFSGALSLATDMSGNLYVAERLGNRIRKINLRTNATAIIAGTGTAGFTGDGGPGISAQIHAPAHLVIDGLGNIYFADSLNNRIRKIAAGSFIISTVAGSSAGFSGDGGPATSAQLNNPQGVALDSAGNLYIADTGNNRIRKVSAATGIITTVIGAAGDCSSTASSLDSPDSIAIAKDVMYIADDTGNRIWKVPLNVQHTPPVLTSITPSSGVQGATVTATLAGSGFATGGCLNSGTTVTIGGTGVTVAKVEVTSNTSLTATFVIAPNAAPGARDVNVATDGGKSSASPFTVTIAVTPVPPPTITSITPSSGARASTPTITITGTNFDTKPGNTGVSGDAGLSIAQVVVSSATSLTGVLSIAPDTALGDHSLKVVTPSGSSNSVTFTVLPDGLQFVYGLPKILNPTEQAPIQVSLANASPDTVTATLTLTFNPNASNGTDDPNVMFVNSQRKTRTATVTFPANTPTAQLSLPDGLLQAGTEAGTIQLSITDVQIAGVATTSDGNSFDVQIPRLVPVITNVRILNKNSGGFDVEVTGYSTSREITTARFDFGAASGANLLTVELQPDVNGTFTSYYQSDVSSAVGGAFVYLQPFIVKQGDVNAVASITVTLSNSQGASEPKTAQ